MEEEGGALGRGVDDVAGVEVEVLPVVVDSPDLVGVCVGVFLCVCRDGIVCP